MDKQEERKKDDTLDNSLYVMAVPKALLSRALPLRGEFLLGRSISGVIVLVETLVLLHHRIYAMVGCSIRCCRAGRGHGRELACRGRWGLAAPGSLEALSEATLRAAEPTFLTGYLHDVWVGSVTCFGCGLLGRGRRLRNGPFH